LTSLTFIIAIITGVTVIVVLLCVIAWLEKEDGE